MGVIKNSFKMSTNIFHQNNVINLTNPQMQEQEAYSIQSY